MYSPVSSHPYILICSGSCSRACIPASSYTQIPMCLLLTSYPHILLSLGSCTLCARWYPRILTSSYPYVHVLRVLVGILASWHPHYVHVLRLLVGILGSWHSPIFTFMYSGCRKVAENKTNLWYYLDVFREYGKRPVAWNELTLYVWCPLKGHACLNKPAAASCRFL